MQAKDYFCATVQLPSQNISIETEGSLESAHEKSFGGINIIICCDPHQFLPVTRSIRDARFYPWNIVTKL